MSKKFYITTAIDYVNSLPHIGTAYEKIGADVIARWKRFEGYEVHFQMGNDEHSVNVKKEAVKQGLSPKEYCDRMREKFCAIWKQMGLSFNDFIQTSEPRHHVSASRLFEDIYKVVKMHGLEKKVIFTGYVNLEEKRALYKGARFLISPSYWEGFGMHILESMACGTPVVVSSKGSLAEIAGSAGIYADPYDVDSISKAIEKLVKMGSMEYKKLSLRCIERALVFSWEKTAEETLEVLKMAGNNKQWTVDSDSAPWFAGN